MSAFVDACRVEQDAMQDIIPFLEKQCPRYILTSKGRLSKELQMQYGDAIAQTHNGKVVAIEFKAEQKNKHGNLFLETWSNRSRFTPGWMYNLNADMLLYYFLKPRGMVTMSFPALRKWAFHSRNIYRYPELEQNKRDQKNDTWGRCVPISALVNHKDIKAKVYLFNGDPGEAIEADFLPICEDGND